MKKDFQNTVIFILLVVGLGTYIVDVLTQEDPTPDEPVAEEYGQQEDEAKLTVEPLSLQEAEEDLLQEVDIEALKEELRKEILTELQADMKEYPLGSPETSEPEEVGDPEETVSPAEEQTSEEEVVVDIEKEEALVKPVVVRTPEIGAMENVLAAMDAQIQVMKETIRTEDQYLTQEKARIRSWLHELENKYEDKTFAVTKTRAEARELQKAVASWKRRQRRHMARKELLEEAKILLALRKEQLREARRRL